MLVVLASSMKLEYPMSDSLPNIEHSRDRFLAKLFAYRKQPEQNAKDEDFELLYAYGMFYIQNGLSHVLTPLRLGYWTDCWRDRGNWPLH
jgi:hypothetical protein